MFTISKLHNSRKADKTKCDFIFEPGLSENLYGDIILFLYFCQNGISKMSMHLLILNTTLLYFLIEMSYHHHCDMGVIDWKYIEAKKSLVMAYKRCFAIGLRTELQCENKFNGSLFSVFYLSLGIKTILNIFILLECYAGQEIRVKHPLCRIILYMILRTYISSTFI